MSDQEQHNDSSPFYEEAGAVIFEKPKSQEEIARQRRENEQHEFARQQVKTNKKLAWLTGLLVLGTFCGTSIGIWQATISQKAANAAKSAADTARNSLVLDQQAWVTFSGMKEGLTVGAENDGAEIINSGNTPARNVVVVFDIFIRKGRYILSDDDAKWMDHILSKSSLWNNESDVINMFIGQLSAPFEFHVGILGPKNSHALHIIGVGEAINTRSFPDKKFVIEQSMVVFGRITYIDIFDKSRVTTFCTIRQAGAGNRFGPCSVYNDMQ